MASAREWDVTIRGRIEHVTDQEVFPDLFQAALKAEDGITVVRFDHATQPHSTSAVIRISATRKLEAERRVRDIVIRVLQPIARSITDDKAFGWAISADAVAVS